MKRKAILIESSDVIGERELPGARVDITNWENFLKSDLGGAWQYSEIVILHKPTSIDVQAHLEAGKDHYCFVAFSGHGCDGTVVLNESWVNKGYPIANLRPKGDQGTLILDSCRGVTEAMLYSFTQTKYAFANEAGHAVALHARRGQPVVFASASEITESIRLTRAGLVNKFREKWDEALRAKSKGIVEMLACAKGQAAGESPSAGGYYTSLLLQSADLWKDNGTISTVHTTKDAHDYAVSKLPPQQTPEYNPSWLNFPFAVKK